MGVCPNPTALDFSMCDIAVAIHAQIHRSDVAHCDRNWQILPNAYNTHTHTHLTALYPGLPG